MRKLFRVTYEIVTPESAEQGDYAEIGFVHENGGRDDLMTVHCYVSGGAEAYAICLRSALTHCSPSYDCGRWFSSYPETLSFQTGADISTSLHPPKNVTASSYARLKRLLGVKH